jgi:hypothetical protein
VRHRAATLTVVALVSAVAPAVAHAEKTVDVIASGQLIATWHGDAARGCAQAGVCDVAGSTTLASDEGESEATGSGGDLLDLLSIEAARSVIRVVRGAPENPSGICLDGMRAAELAVEPRSARAGRVRLALASREFPPGAGLSAGRCAGPLPEEIAAAMPAVTVTTRSLRARHIALDFSGRRSFAAGPFSGTVTSTLKLRARVAKATADNGFTSSEDVGGGHAQRVNELELGYLATPVAGALVTEFRGGPAPGCTLLDACGLVGTYRLTAAKPLPFGLFAIAPARRGRRATLESMLGALRSRRARIFPSGSPLRVPASATVDVTRDGATACHDVRGVALPSLAGQVHGDHVTLTLLGTPSSFGVGDALRTHCPGPAHDAQRDGAFAAGSVPISQLGAPKLTVTLTPRRLNDPDYATQARGSLTLELRRTTQEVRG